MSQTTTQWILELVDKITGPMKDVISSSKKAADGVEDIGDKADESGEKLKGLSAIDLFAINDAVQNIASEFNKINAPGAAFNAQLKELEAITGVTGDALEELGDKGRATAKAFGGDASAMLKSYKGVLSRLGPDIGKNQDALELMGVNIATLSKTMGNDAVGAMDALTTSMLQFGVDLSDPMQAAEQMGIMMNIMAAGAKEGAKEVPGISAGLKVAGTEALKARVQFSEANAALQALAQGGKTGSEAGTALRNVLGKMAGIDVVPREAAEKLQALGVNYDIVSDKSLPFTTRLRELAKAQGDATIMAQIFGTENSAAAEILLRSVDYQDQLRDKITGTNTATEQATIIMSGYNERMSRVKAWFNDLAIGMFDVTSRLTPFVDGLAGAVMVTANMSNAHKGVKLLFDTMKTIPAIGTMFTAFSTVVTGGFGVMGTAVKAFGVAIMNIPIIGWIAALVAGLVALGVYLWNTSSTFRGVLYGIWEVVKLVFGGIGDFISSVWNNVVKPVFQAYYDVWKWVITGIWDGVKWIWGALKDIGGWLLDNVLKPVKDVFGGIYDWVVGIIDKIIDKLAAPIRFIKGLFSQVAGAYKKGTEKGIADYYADHPEEKAKEEKATIGPKLRPDDLKEESTDGTQSEESQGSGSGGTSLSLEGAGLNRTGGGSSRTINQKIDIKQYFTISGDSSRAEFESIAEKVVRAINEKLGDSLVAVS